jgi:hypothetical protein
MKNSKQKPAKQAITKEVIEQYNTYLRENNKSSTQRSQAKNFLNFISDHKELQSQSKDSIIDAYKEELRQQGSKPSTVSSYGSAANKFFEWAEKNGQYSNVEDKSKDSDLDEDCTEKPPPSPQTVPVEPKVEDSPDKKYSYKEIEELMKNHLEKRNRGFHLNLTHPLYNKVEEAAERHNKQIAKRRDKISITDIINDILEENIDNYVPKNKQ